MKGRTLKARLTDTPYRPRRTIVPDSPGIPKGITPPKTVSLEGGKTTPRLDRKNRKANE